jgi:hypothetical protein
MSDKYLNLTGLGTLWAKIKTALAGKQDDLSAVLPTDASATNQLATKAYADAIGERLEARYLGSAADGSPFATHAALTAATAYYYQGTATTPDTNDITTVTADEDHIGTTGEASTTRYRWNGTGWAFEYVINNTGLSEAQLMAVNSGITAAKVSGYDGLSGKISDEASARQTADNAKLNIDGTNATSTGIGTALSKIDIENGAFTDADYFVVRDKDATASTWRKKYASTLWTYIKGKFGGVGDYQTPVYFSADGTPTPMTASLGSTSKPVYLESGKIKACTASAGTSSKPVYMSSGTITACGSTIGSSTRPVYMNAGTITACDQGSLDYATITSGGSKCYGVYIGGTVQTAATTRVNIDFIVSISNSATDPLNCYFGRFAFRGSLGAMNLTSLGSIPSAPWRIAYVDNTADGGHTLGLWIIPTTPATYGNIKITRIHSAEFTFAPAACAQDTYNELVSAATSLKASTVLPEMVVGSVGTDSNTLYFV